MAVLKRNKSWYFLESSPLALKTAIVKPPMKTSNRDLHSFPALVKVLQSTARVLAWMKRTAIDVITATLWVWPFGTARNTFQTYFVSSTEWPFFLHKDSVHVRATFFETQQKIPQIFRLLEKSPWIRSYVPTWSGSSLKPWCAAWCRGFVPSPVVSIRTHNIISFRISCDITGYEKFHHIQYIFV